MKPCIKCKNTFEASSMNFYKNKHTIDGLESVCKICRSEYDKQYRALNKEKVYAKCREWNNLNKSKLVETTQTWIENNKDRHKEIKNNSFKKYMSNPENKNKRREYDREYTKQKRQTNTEYQIKDSIGSMVYYHLKERKSEHTIEYLGCPINEYVVYLENMFLPEMDWSNYGVIWEIDHIIPISSFDLNQEKYIYEAFNYQNTQPLFKTTQIAESFGYIDQIGNRNKSNKLI
jgi:hypothetical protein